jgi:hypothetical protein
LTPVRPRAQPSPAWYPFFRLARFELGPQDEAAAQLARLGPSHVPVRDAEVRIGERIEATDVIRVRVREDDEPDLARDDPSAARVDPVAPELGYQRVPPLEEAREREALAHLERAGDRLADEHLRSVDLRLERGEARLDGCGRSVRADYDR